MEFYGDIKEEIHPNTPEARGLPNQKNLFVDTDHAGDRMSHWSHIVLTLFLNKSPVV